MAQGELDIDKIQRQLAVLMTNSVEFQSKMYDIFVSSTPMDVEVKVWTDENAFETIKVPNRAKGNIPAQFGSENPEGAIEASYGTIYFNEVNGKLYIKTALSGTDGWQGIVTGAALEYHNTYDLNAHEGTLAKIHGDENTEFKVADITNESPDSLAVNKGSLFALLGGLESLKTDDKSSIVSAINELVDFNHSDGPSAVIVDTATAIDPTSNKSRILSLEQTQSDTYRIRVLSPFIAVDSKGIKHRCPAMSLELAEADVIIKSTGGYSGYSVFVSFELEDMDSAGNPRLRMLPGRYYVSAHKPYLMQEKDSWLDIGNMPYTVKVMERNSTTNELDLVERNYVYLGSVEEVH